MRFVFRICFICLMFLCHVFVVQAQESIKQSKIKTNLGYSSYSLVIFNIKMNNLTIDGTYNLTKTIEVGGTLGCGFYKKALNIRPGLIRYSGQSKAFIYGVVANFHPLQLLAKSKNMRLNIYLQGRLGGNYRFSEANEIFERENVLTYGTYIGLAYYFGQHWGAFFEYGFSNSYNMRYGLALKF